MAEKFGYGDRTWPNIESLICDAAGYKSLAAEVKDLRNLIGAMVAAGPIRVPTKAIEAHLNFRTLYDPHTMEYIVSRVDPALKTSA